MQLSVWGRDLSLNISFLLKDTPFCHCVELPRAAERTPMRWALCLGLIISCIAVSRVLCAAPYRGSPTRHVSSALHSSTDPGRRPEREKIQHTAQHHGKSTTPTPLLRLARRATPSSTNSSLILRKARGEAALDDTANSRMRARLLAWVARNVWARLVGPRVAARDDFERRVARALRRLPRRPRLQDFGAAAARTRAAAEARGRRPERDPEHLAALTARQYHIEHTRFERSRWSMRMAGPADVRRESTPYDGARVAGNVRVDTKASAAPRRQTSGQAKLNGEVQR